ncbi:MAG: hypothetical protein J5I90_22760 [Caldilineales bacterium]|nr:hypothetical protein [Caldilineales bacterium]
MTTDLSTAPDYEEIPLEIDLDDAEFAIERGMNFADGFQFGCGFWAAGLIALILGILAIMLLSFLLSFVGISLLG